MNDAQGAPAPGAADGESETQALPAPTGVDPRAETKSLAGHAAPLADDSTSLRGEIARGRLLESSVEPGLGPGSVLGQFEILGELGRGGMGVVYRVLDRDLDREVALKLLSPDLSQRPVELERFRREAALASKLRHPRIVSVYSFGELGGRMFYTMPIVEGRTLRDVLREGRLPPRRAATLLEQVARAIDAAHQQRVVHRDLKPANIVLDEDGTPLVVDFGLAKDLARDPELTRTGEVLGTPSYMSPEQARGESARVDHRVDVYALGAILYELLSGQVPYPGETVNEVIQKILHTDLVAPSALVPDVPRDLETVCLKALMDEPYLRYQTAGALADDLSRYLHEEPVHARRPGLGARVVRAVRRHRGASFMGAVLLIVVLIGAAFYERGTERLAVRQRSDQALELVERARVEERRGDVASAAQTFHEAYLLAQGAYTDHPRQPKIREAFLRVLRTRADFAERGGSWTLAEELRDLCFRLSESGEDERLLQRARKRGRGEITVSGLSEGETLDLVPWDRDAGRADAGNTSRRRRATRAVATIELPTGSYLATHRITDRAEEALPRYLVPVAAGQRHAIHVADPGVPPEGMLYVPAASFVVPDTPGAPEVAQAGPVWIERTEVTVAAYLEFLAHVEREGHAACGGCGKRNHRPAGLRASGRVEGEAKPITGISWYDASAYAHWRGWRLPTREEWLLAGGVADGRTYPWGDRWEEGRCNTHPNDLAPVETYSRDVSPYEVLGLAGNGDEWCADPAQAPREPATPHRLIVGGGFGLGASGGALAQVTFAGADQRFADTSFRCVADAPPANPLPLGVELREPEVAPPRPEGAEPIHLRVAAWPRYADPRFARAFQRRHLAATGVEVRVEQAVTVSSNDDYLPLLEQGKVDLVTPSCDMAPSIIRSGYVQPFEFKNEGDMLPAFRRPPFLQHAGRGYGACYASGPMWLVSLDRDHVADDWSALWDPSFKGQVAIWDDGVWAVTLAALDLGLGPAADLSLEALPQVIEHLIALLRNGCRTWRTPQEALSLVRDGGVTVIDDWGILSWELTRTGDWVQRLVPESGSALWIDSWMIGAHLGGAKLEAARAWVEYAVSPENQRDLLLLAGYDPTNRRTVRLLDKATALTRLKTIRERQLRGLERWREIPQRERYLKAWAEAKARAQ